MTYKSHVIIDFRSADRDKGTNEEPIFYLSHQIKFSQSPTKSYWMRLEGTLIPKTFYDVDATNNFFRITDSVGINDATIPPGNYTITELLTELESQLDMGTNDGSAFTLTYDDITNKVTILFVSAGSNTIDTIANGSTLNALLGFGNTTVGETDVAIVLATTVDTEATYTVDLDTKSYIFVETNITSANYYNKNIQAHIGAIVPINVDRNEKQYFENTDGHLTLLNNRGPMSQVSFHLRDELTNTIALNGAGWSTTMAIYELTELHKL